MGQKASKKARRRLSVAMIVRDAQDTLARTLESVSKIADEIVVLDTGSVDYTRDIASRFTKKVYGYQWNDNFAAARNDCAEKTAGDWLLWLDAAEVLSEEDARQLRDFVDTKADPKCAYMMYISVPPEISGASSERVGRLRLLPQSAGLQFQGRVAEQVATSAIRAGLEISELPWTLLRSNREHRTEIKTARAKRNLYLAGLEISEKGPVPKALVVQGDALQVLGRMDEARSAFRRALQNGVRGSLERLEAYYGLLTTFETSESDRSEQMDVCIEALEEFSFDAQLLCAMGSYMQTQERLDLAVRAFRAAFQYGQLRPEIWHLSDIAEVASICLSVCLQLQQKEEEAIQVLQQSLERYPQASRVRMHLVELYVKQGSRAEALELSGSLDPKVHNIEAIRSAIRGAVLAVENNWISALAYLQTAYSVGCREAFCMRWLSVALLSTNSFDAAERLLDEWEQLEPGNSEVAKYREYLVESTGVAQTEREQLTDSPSGKNSHMRIDEAKEDSIEKKGPERPAAKKINP